MVLNDMIVAKKSIFELFNTLKTYDVLYNRIINKVSRACVLKRREDNLTQKELGIYLGINRRKVIKIENGDCDIPLSLLCKLVVLLEIDDLEIKE